MSVEGLGSRVQGLLGLGFGVRDVGHAGPLRLRRPYSGQRG